MLNHTIKALLAMLGMAILLIPAANAEKPGKIAVCHAPPGNPENTKLIQVGAKGNAVNAHLAHGDWLATAAVCADDIDDNDCDGSADDPDAENYDCVVLTGNADATCLDRACIEPPPEVSCPCWTEEELAALSDTITSCKENENRQQVEIGNRFIGDGAAARIAGDPTSDDLICAYEKATPEISRLMVINEAELAICHDSIRDECEARGIPLD